MFDEPCTVSGLLVLINTGITDPVVGCKPSPTIDLFDTTALDREVIEKQELARIESAASDVQELVYGVSQMVDVQPWDTNPENATVFTKYGDDSSSVSSGTTATIQPVSVNVRSRRRCLVLVLVLLLLIVLGSSLVGLLAGILKW